MYSKPALSVWLPFVIVSVGLKSHVLRGSHVEIGPPLPNSVWYPPTANRGVMSREYVGAWIICVIPRSFVVICRAWSLYPGVSCVNRPHDVRMSNTVVAESTF